MVFCGSCGNNCPDGMRFCTTCGAPLGSGSSPAPSRTQSQQSAPPAGRGGGGGGPAMAKNRVAPNAPSQAPGGGGWVQGEWTEDSAFDTPLALKESQRWIEAVTGERFKSPDFVQSTRDGILLCKLINNIVPGSVPRINLQNTAFAQRENISNFIAGCKKLGLKETQCFVTNDLFENQQIRTVAITLYWLGRAARAMPGYRGPQMRMSMFCKMKCSRCNKPILDENYIVTMNEQWHTSCANCDNCSNPLGEGYVQDGNKVYCPNCAGGGGPGKCASCQKSIGPSEPFAENNGKPYCEDCHCANCQNPVQKGKGVQAAGRNFCTNCCCLHCKRPF